MDDEKKTAKEQAIPPDNTREFKKARAILRYYRDYVTIFERENSQQTGVH
jgi:hypothetical protein